MRKRAAIFAIAMLGARLGTGTVLAADQASSATVIGAEPLLTEGAYEMLSQRWQKGIELTEQGLTTSIDTSQRAAGYSNLCAAYVAIGDFDHALASCDESLKLDATNWRTYNNRAGALLGKGRIDEALHDVETGIAIAPMSDTLRKTESIVRDRLKSLYAPRHRAAAAS